MTHRIPSCDRYHGPIPWEPGEYCIEQRSAMTKPVQPKSVDMLIHLKRKMTFDHILRFLFGAADAAAPVRKAVGSAAGREKSAAANRQLND